MIAVKPKAKTLKEIVIESAYDSTTHSIPHIFKRENTCVKLFWFICFVTSASVCAFMIEKAITSYFRFETVTKAESVYEVPTPFPTVSICNSNPYTTQKAFDFNRNYLESNGLDLEKYWMYDFSNSFVKFRYAVGVNIRINASMSDEMRKQMGMQLDDMLLLCTYNQFPCSSNDFEWYFDTLYGSCYSFNSGKDSFGNIAEDRYSTKAGSLNGLTLELFVGEPTNPYSLSFMKGLQVEIHNKSAKPFFLNGFSVGVGSYTKVTVRREFSSRLESPYSECIRDIDSYAQTSIYVRTILEANMTYRQSDCFNVCLQKYIVGICHCYIVEFPYWNTTLVEPCKSFNQMNCFVGQYQSFFNTDINQRCPNACPLECDSVSYTTSVSAADYPSYVYSQALSKNPIVQRMFNNRTNVTYEELKSNILYLSVFYDELGYRSMYEAEKMNIIDLVSNIGGTLGLFLGMSFLSFVEIIDLVFNLLLALCTRSSKTSY